MRCATAGRRGGFTLIETLVVLGVLATLVGLLLPAVQQVRGAAVQSRCTNNLRQVGLALHAIHDRRGQFPPGFRFLDESEPYLFQSWQAALLPYLEQWALWEATQRAYEVSPIDPYQNPPHVGYSTVVRVLTCPADGRLAHSQPAEKTGRTIGLTSYLGASGVDLGTYDGTLFVDSRVRLTDITDGSSQTLLAGERPPPADREYGSWYSGAGQVLAPMATGSADCVLGARERNVGLPALPATHCPEGPYHFGPGTLGRRCDVFHFWSMHAGGANFLFGDGSVHFLRYSADGLLPALASRAGGEAVFAFDE